MTVLVVAPHPDDDVLGCGGVMARHVARGDNVHVLVVTRGAPELVPMGEVERNRKQLREAHRVLGVTEARFLDFPAARLDTVPGHELADTIGICIREIQPSVVYLPHGGDIHADHQAVHLATLVAARPINGCSVKKLLTYETLSETEWGSPRPESAFIPTVFVDIADYLETKSKAMNCLKMQLKKFPHPRSLEGIEALARLRGATVGVSAAEAFSLAREVIE